MDRRIQLLCVWCGPAFLLLFVVGFWLLAGLVPPPEAEDSVVQIGSFYRSNAEQLRVGMLVLLIVAPLAYVQVLLGVVTMLELLLPVILIGTAAFRPDRPLAQIQLLNDTAFTI